MNRIAIATVLAAFFSSHAAGQGFDSMQVAVDLGTVLGAEAECSLSYDQQAITAFIEDKVDDTDMGFASMLQTMTQGQEYQLMEMSTSSKTAHCTQIARVAKAYGFIE